MWLRSEWKIFCCHWSNTETTGTAFAVSGVGSVRNADVVGSVNELQVIKIACLRPSVVVEENQ